MAASSSSFIHTPLAHADNQGEGHQRGLGGTTEQQIAELLRPHQELIRTLQNRDNSSSHKGSYSAFALKSGVEKEIDRLEKEGIIEKVESSE
ncbi:hypothetical protein TNCV_2970461 [Trichonephila clavipes]|nr:hypothetical protein TNCV_2970461 [Trichonephila clavipes]